MNNDIYVVVADEDGGDGGSIVLETLLRSSSIEDACQRVSVLNGRLGMCRLARLEFVNPLRYGFRDSIKEVTP